MVAKQQQLEWLANRFESLPFDSDSILMSDETLGYIGYGHKITNQELKRERDKMQKKAEQVAQPAPDNSWHERGELPPVGCECVWVDESGVDGPTGSLYPCVGDTVSVCAHRQTPGGNVIAIFTWDPGDDGLRVAASRMPEDFRPLRTEREKAIDTLIDIICAGGYFMRRDGGARKIAERIYDAGLLK